MFAFVAHDRVFLTAPLLVGLSLGAPWLLFTRVERAQLTQLLRERFRPG
jgi:hypothetical protein